jgi:hypothetical protein
MYPAFEIRVSAKYLQSIRMLMDWQLREMGIDPDSLVPACEALDEYKKARAKEEREMTEAERAYGRMSNPA